MNYHYSATTNAFYPEDMLDAYIQAGTLPGDLSLCSEEEFKTFTSAQAVPEGMCRGPSISGKPVWVPIPPQTTAEAASAGRSWRDAELSRADIELNKVQDGIGVGTVTQWRAYRVALRNWPTTDGWPESTKPVSPDYKE